MPSGTQPRRKNIWNYNKVENSGVKTNYKHKWKDKYLIEQIKEIYIVRFSLEMLFKDSRNVVAKYNPIIYGNKTNLR